MQNHILSSNFNL